MTLDEISARLPPDSVHQGLLLEARPLESLDIADLPGKGLVLVLDQVTDPHNVGAIVRTAAAFAFETGLHLAETPSRLAGLTVAVADPAAVAARLAAAGIAHTRVDGAVVVAPAVAHGVAVTFRKDIQFI